MKFKEVFSEAWKDYRSNFWLYTKIMFLFFIIPSLFFFGIETFFNITSLTTENISPTKVFYFLTKIIVTFLFSIFYTVMILSSSLFNKKNLGSAYAEGKKYYWKYFTFRIVVFIFSFVLYMLLIIPGIVFSVYWAFAGIILIAEKKKIVESLKESFQIIKGRWWKIFGYYVLFFLIVFLITILISIIRLPLGIYLFIDAFNNPEFYLNLEEPTLIMIIQSYLNYAANLIQTTIITPLTILFTKNFFQIAKKQK